MKVTQGKADVSGGPVSGLWVNPASIMFGRRAKNLESGHSEREQGITPSEAATSVDQDIPYLIIETAEQ